MTKNSPSGAKKHRESTKPQSHQTAKMFFFLSSSSSSSDGLHNSFSFHTKQQHFSLSSALAHHFFPGLKSHEAIRTAH